MDIIIFENEHLNYRINNYGDWKTYISNENTKNYHQINNETFTNLLTV